MPWPRPAPALLRLPEALSGTLPLEGALPEAPVADDLSAVALWGALVAATPSRPVLFSGGLDSSALLAASPKPQAVRIDEPGVDPAERARGEALLEALGVEALVVELGHDDLVAGFARAVRAAGLPLWHPRGVARVLAWEALAARNITEVVSGVGADELFGAWPRDALHDRTARRARLLLREGRYPVALPRPDQVAEAVPEAIVPASTLDERLRALSVDPLPLDQAGRAFGVEVSHPFLAGPVRAIAAGLPDGSPGKALLREALAGRIPEVIRAAAKGGRPLLADPEGWILALVDWLAPWRLEAVPEVDPAQVARVLVAYATGEAADPDTQVAERLLMRLAGLVALREAL